MTAPRHRHVWVLSPPDRQTYPGLALELEQRGDAWWAQVTYVVGEKAITEWLPLDRVKPVQAKPYTGSAYG